MVTRELEMSILSDLHALSASMLSVTAMQSSACGIVLFIGPLANTNCAAPCKESEDESMPYIDLDSAPLRRHGLDSEVIYSVHSEVH